MRFTMFRPVIYFIFLFLPALVLSLSCNSTTAVQPSIEEESSTLAKVCQIHLQASFSQTYVYVNVDSSRVFQGNVSTGSTLGYAAIIPVQVSRGTHALSVFVLSSALSAFPTDTTFTIADTLYIGVNFDANAGKITFTYRTTPFQYD